MKIGHLAALPLLAKSQDDTSTLLSLRAQVTLETGVDHLLDAVGSRNVTQMSSLLQNLVEETISEGPYQLDGDVTTALEVIKQELLGDIRGALNEAHCYDQVELHNQILCFEGCEHQKKIGSDSCPKYCDGSKHKDCRMELVHLYKKHITSCRALDDLTPIDWCPVPPKKCCLLSHTTWNCGGLCHTQISGMTVDDSFGDWLQEIIAKFQAHYNTWLTLHGECVASYHQYVQADAICDCMQAECETNNCEYETCEYLNCEDNYNRCWAGCEAEYTRTNKAKECLEKDRKIDWSATEKIECYVDVLLKKPTKEQLLAECGTDDCYNKYREAQYKKCNTICPEVDFDAAWGEHDRRAGDQDVTKEGIKEVRTEHRAADGSDVDVRCTGHLDLDYQVPPCCNPCDPRPEPPCTGKGGYDVGASMSHTSYMWLHYGHWGAFDTHDIKDFSAEKCHGGEHGYDYAYNLCDCIDCPSLPYVPPASCTKDKACCESKGGQYNYRQHDIKVDCSAISDVVVTPYATKHDE
jgi:hypothetical protein